MKERKYELLLALLIATRATSFIFNKILLGAMGTMTLLAVRFLITALLMTVIFPKRVFKMNSSSLLGGLAIGLTFFLVMISELSALKTADTSLVSTVEHTSIILVPVMEAFIVKKLPERNTMIGAFMAFAGIICIGLQQGSLSGSVGLSLLAAFLYALVIIITDKVTTEKADPIAIGIVQLAAMGALALVFSLFTEEFSLPATPLQWGMLAYLIVVCSAFGFTLTPYAQSHVSVERAGILCAVNPAVAALLGVVILHEHMGLLGAVGLLLILGSIIMPYLIKT